MVFFTVKWSWPHNPNHRFERLTRVDIGLLFRSFSYTNFSFQSHHSILGLSFNIIFFSLGCFLKLIFFQLYPSTLDLFTIELHDFFFHVEWSWPYNPNHRFERLTQVGIGLLFRSFSYANFSFQSHLSILGLLEIELHDFLYFFLCRINPIS